MHDFARLLTWLLVPLIVALWAGCGGCGDEPAAPNEPPPGASSTPRGSDLDVDIAPVPPKAKAASTAKMAAKTMLRTLGNGVVDAAASHGAGGAFEACNPRPLAAQVKDTMGAEAGWTSARLRNPANQAPDWVLEFLARHGEGPLKTLAFDKRFVPGPDGEGEVFHYVRLLRVEKGCLQCHGGPADIPPDVAAAIAEKYPEDKAAGYAEGDIRGAIWGSIPVVP